jgi:hypothetical protein
MALLNAGVANMIYEQGGGAVRQATDFKEFEDGLHWAQTEFDYNCESAYLASVGKVKARTWCPAFQSQRTNLCAGRKMAGNAE